ncbi:MAG TPA: ORF6N domain-containing protein [Thermoanaerobaculia bacterium]
MEKAKILVLAQVDRTILTIRGERVMLDRDLAEVYGVTTKVLNQAVKRNELRFPSDFRFQLTTEEREEVVTNCDHLQTLKYAAALPWAFTEHGVIMAAAVLNSPRAVEMSVFVVRAFVRLREFARGHTEIARRLDALEQKVTEHDDDLREMFNALRALLTPSPRTGREIGFVKKGGR